jgi:enamine deaminase RidA (YjgF/YER057c/UK114 family)
LAALGIILPDAPAPVGAYVPARRVGDVLYTSGQLPFVEGELLATGIVGQRGGDVTVERAHECARVAAINVIAVLAAAAGGVDNIAGIIKVNGYVASAPEFTAHPAVMNGASGVFVEVFGESGRHARSVVGVAALPMGSPVEVEVIAQLVS